MKRVKLIEINIDENMKINEFKYIIITNNEGSVEISELRTYSINEPNFVYNVDDSMSIFNYIQGFSQEILDNS